MEMVEGETYLIVVATKAWGWSYNQVSLILGKAWDTGFLEVSDFGLLPVQSDQLKWQGLMDQFIEDEG
jgi:hypothetical protein